MPTALKAGRQPTNIAVYALISFSILLFSPTMEKDQLQPQMTLSYMLLIFSFLLSAGADPLLECLNHHSEPYPPISEALYLSSNSSFGSVLTSYMRNQLFNHSSTSKPRFILTALHVSHIQAAIICAKSHRLEVRIRSGGHDFEGLSYMSLGNTPFIILDMYNFREINVNIRNETAWVEAGATLGELYHRIAEKSNVHAFPGGMCPSVGVGGQFSGGGFGNLIRKYGLAADHVIDAILVDGSGRILNRTSMGEDLFWAITGGGGSSFGVIVSYKIRLVSVPPAVTFARIRITDDDDNFSSVAHKYVEVVDKLPEELYIKLAVDVIRVSETRKSVRGSFVILFLGNAKRTESVFRNHFPELGLTKRDCREVSWVESVVLWTNISSTESLLSRIYPFSMSMKRKSDLLKKPISKRGLKLIFEKMKELETPILKFFPLGGIMNEISETAKPFPHRAGNIAVMEIATNWKETGAEAADYYKSLTRKLYEELTPFVSESREAYLNYRDIELGINRHDGRSYSDAAAGYGMKYFKNNFERLVEIKSKVDSDNFFRHEQSIPVRPLMSSE